MDKDTLCALPFMHFNIMPNGQASPCCQSPEPIRDENGRAMNLRTDTIKEIWNAADFRYIRTSMLNGKQPRHCIGCYVTEENGFKSTRVNYNSMILDEGEYDSKFTGFSRVSRNNFQEIMGQPAYFDLRFDNVCNLKCVMCFAAESSSIERDNVHTSWTKEIPIERVPNRFNNSKKWVASDLLYEELVDIGSNTEYIRLAGGEPFRSALALRWLNYLGQSGKARDITIQIYTNLQLFNDRIIQLLAPFRYISFVLSIDGTEDTYEYICYPGKWDTLTENCNRLDEARKGPLNCSEVSINATMSLVGATRILDVFEFGSARGYGVNLSNAVDPTHASTRYLPTRTKKRLEQYLRDYAEKHQYESMFPLIDQWMQDMYSVDIRKPEHIEAARDAMRFINDMDSSRSLNFKKLNPPLVFDFVSELGEWCDENKYVSSGQLPIISEAIGIISDDKLTIESEAYIIRTISGGSVETIHESAYGFNIQGWAIDMLQRRAAARLCVVVGDDVVDLIVPSKFRADIQAGFGEAAAQAGFTVHVTKRGNRPTLDEPIRLFALTNENFALPIAADFSANYPIAYVTFETAP